MKPVKYEKRILLKLSGEQHTRLKEYAKQKQTTVSEVVRTSVNRTMKYNKSDTLKR